MATKSFSYSLKKIKFLILCFFLAGCSGLRTRESIRTPPLSAPNATTVPEALRPPVETPTATETSKEVPPAVAKAENPKIGLILGPGSARALAHIGVVQELTKAKLPISHIVGLEMGALIGAIYAQKAQPFDVEWQIAKMKDIKSLGPFLQGVFGSNKAEDLRLPFACPAYNLSKSQYFMMNRGIVTQMLPYCLPVPPHLKPFNHNVAAMTELKSSIDYLKSKGANFIVYVHVLPSKDGVISGNLEDENNFLWTLASVSIAKQWQAVDYVITVPVQDYDLNDWSHRRELIQKGIEAGQNASSQISKRLGL